MKKAILTVLVVLQICALCFSSGCADASKSASSLADPEANGKDIAGVQPVDTIDERWEIAEYWQDFRSENPGSDLTVDLVYSFADLLWESGNRVLLENDFYINYYVFRNWYDYGRFVQYGSYVDFRPGSEKDREKEVYLLFIATITNCLEDCFYDSDLNWSPYSYNRLRRSSFYVFLNDDKNLVKEAKEMIKARNYQVTDLSDDYLTISFQSFYIHRVNDSGINLYDSIRSASSCGCADLKSPRPVNERSDTLSTSIDCPAASEAVALSACWEDYLDKTRTEKITINSVYEFASELWKSQKPILTRKNRVVNTFTHEQWLANSGAVKTVKIDNKKHFVFDPGKADDVSSGIYWLIIATITECLSDSYLDPYSLYDLSSERLIATSFMVSFDYDELGYKNCTEQVTEDRNQRSYGPDDIRVDEGLYLFSMFEPLINNAREAAECSIKQQGYPENIFDALRRGES